MAGLFVQRANLHGATQFCRELCLFVATQLQADATIRKALGADASGILECLNLAFAPYGDQ